MLLTVHPQEVSGAIDKQAIQITLDEALKRVAKERWEQLTKDMPVIEVVQNVEASL